MITPLITICGLKEVATTIDHDFSYMLSILSLDDFMPTPAWIAKENHLTLRFEDITDPTLAHGQYYAPTKNDIEKIVLFGRKILADQTQTVKPLELLIHCAAGRSRSPGRVSAETVIPELQMARAERPPRAACSGSA